MFLNIEQLNIRNIAIAISIFLELCYSSNSYTTCTKIKCIRSIPNKSNKKLLAEHERPVLASNFNGGNIGICFL